MSFKHEFSPRFQEVDRAGIVFYGRAFDYAHICYEEMLTAAFGNFDHVYSTAGVGLPLVHADSSFRKPMLRGERLVATMEIERLSQRSITFNCTISGIADGEIRCVVRQKHAFVAFPEFEPTERPPDFLDRLLAIGMVEPKPASKA